MAASEGRAPPAFQEFAANMLASRPLRVAKASTCGVVLKARLEAWVNRTLPSEPSAIALVLGFDLADVTAAMPTLMHFFALENGELRCPELDAYRAHLERIRAAQSDGGKHGSAILHQKRGHSKPRASKGSEGDSLSKSQVAQGSTHDSLVQPSPVQSSQEKQSLKRAFIPDPFVLDIEAAEKVFPCTAADYQRAKGG